MKQGPPWYRGRDKSRAIQVARAINKDWLRKFHRISLECAYRELGRPTGAPDGTRRLHPVYAWMDGTERLHVVAVGRERCPYVISLWREDVLGMDSFRLATLSPDPAATSRGIMGLVRRGLAPKEWLRDIRVHGRKWAGSPGEEPPIDPPQDH